MSNLLNDNCQGCGGVTENDMRACKGACSQEIYYGGDLGDTKGLISCNCCEDCRLKCHISFMESIKDGEQ